jgi:N-dimethylarginine dimethylaminohydrolase
VLDEILLKNAQRIRADERMCFAMSVPYFISNKHLNNAQMKEINEAYGEVDKDLALAQFDEIYQYCARNFRIYLIPSAAGLQDQVYVSNLGAVFEGEEDESPLVVLSRFRAKGRPGEELVGEPFFQNLGYRTLRSPHFFEGEADIKCIAPGIYVGATGMRTSSEALKWIADIASIRVIDCSINNPYLYHLDCVLFRLSASEVAVVTSVVDQSTLRSIERYANILDVPLDVGLSGATNCIRGNDEILCDENTSLMRTDAPLYEREMKKIRFLEHVAKKRNIGMKFFRTSEFIKSGAALSCMFMRLNNV